MVRGIARLALLEAARQGEYRASFHGFRVQALRQCSAPGSDVFVEVNLCVSFGKNLVERSLVAMDMPQPPCAGLSARPEAATTDAGAMEPMP
ncbi:MAG: hypothetical protein IH604_08875 [Burkholderiales bacterium]|nr:hypothetical protein [Burkholderiales bacterium]